MTNLKIKQNEDNTISIYTPYNPEFVWELKSQVGGCRWDASKRCWTAPETAINTVREIMKSVYGATDAESSELVDLKITFNRYHERNRRSIQFLGYTIAAAYGRDSGARAGEGVEFISGKPDSGGSAANWTTWVPKGAVVVIHGVSKSAAERAIATEYEYDLYEGFDIDLEIIDGSESIDKNALMKEKEALMKRLAEIEDLLK